MAKKKKIRWEDHPSIIVVHGKPRLKIFEEYSVEESLPKFKKLLDEEKERIEKARNENASKSSAVSIVGSEDVAQGNVPFDSSEIEQASGVVKRPSDLQAAKNARWDRTRYVRIKAGFVDRNVKQFENKNSTFWDSVKSWLHIRNSGDPTRDPAHDAEATNEPGTISVEDAFRLAKDSELYMTTEDLLRSRAIAVSLAKRFEQTCQYGMAKKVTDHLDILAAKINLAQHDMCRYITEEQAIDFMTKAEKGVQVEFLRYYPEVLPNDVSKKLAQCNLDMLFDNYVVMFYSKDAKPVRLLEEVIDEEERHRRRDPILFGTIRGSRDLYYIADWVYKDDDLTLETVEKAIGTIPTLKDERIAESQYKIEEAMRDLDEEVKRAVQESKDRGMFIPVSEETMARVGFGASRGTSN